MKRLVVVCGPESAGNRLVAGYLHRAGVSIESSTREQRPEVATDPEPLVGLIVHHEPKLSKAIVAGRKAGREVCMVVLTREIGALTQSMVARDHVTTLADARERMRLSHMEAMDCAIRFDLDFVVVAYESMVLHPRETVANMLRALALPADNLDADIFVQRKWRSAVPEDRNAARYGT